MTKLGMNRLSTFGLLAHLKQTEVVTLIDCLIAAGCLQQVDLDRFRPVVRADGPGRRGDAGRQALDARLSVPAELLWKLRAPRPGSAEGCRRLAPAAETSRRSRPWHPPQLRRRCHCWLVQQCPAGRREPAAALLDLAALSTGFTVEECAAARGLARGGVGSCLRAVEEGWRSRPAGACRRSYGGGIGRGGEEQPRQIRPLWPSCRPALLPAGRDLLEMPGRPIAAGRSRVE